MILHRVTHGSIFLLLIILMTLSFSSPHMPYEDFKKSMSKPFRSSLHRELTPPAVNSDLSEIHEPIAIRGDDQFNDFASMENWPGDGTRSDPYIIEGYNITHSMGDLLVIHHTTVYFIIRNNYINGLTEAWGGILFYNVRNGIVVNNTVLNIDILGIGVYFSEKIIITNNKVNNTNLNGIRIEDCPGPSIITNNTVTYSMDAGIWVGDSSMNVTLMYNSIYGNGYGILFGRDADDYQGVFSSLISKNLIYNNFYGIHLSYSSNNSISYNFISDTHEYGLYLSYTCENTTVNHNNFFDNNVGGNSQAKDSGSNDIFVFNFWNDHTAPDANNDGIVDVPYAIAGTSENLDLFSLSSKNISSDPIDINGNESFATIAAANSWFGNGTSSNPYIIDGLNLTGVSGIVDEDFFHFLLSFQVFGINPICISNTTAYFQIRNCFLTSGTCGVLLSNVTNAYILNNSIMLSTIGIFLTGSSNCTILNNDFSNNLFAGVAIANSELNTVVNNSFQNDGLYLFGWGLTQTMQLEVSGNTINGKEIVFWQNVHDQTVPDGAGQIVLVNCTNIVIITQKLARTNTGLFASFCSNLHVHNSVFIDNKARGFWAWNCENVTISNNTIVNSGIHNGITIHHSTETTISGNIITNSFNCGIKLYGSPVSTLSENSVTNTRKNGIDMDQSANCIIVDNTITNTGDIGISVWNSGYSTLSNNTVTNTEGRGIRFDNSMVGILKENTVINSSIELYSSPQCDLSENYIYNSKDRAILLRGSETCTLTSNFVNTSFYGVTLISSTNCYLSNNTILDCQEIGIVLEVSDDSTLLENFISNTSMIGISLYSSENTALLRNILVNIKSRGIVSWSSGSSTLSGNTISNVGENGIELHNSKRNRLEGNIILNCSESGIFLSESGNNWLNDNIISNGIRLEGIDEADFTQAEVENNSVNGKPIVFLQNTIDRTVFLTAGQVLLINCESIRIIDNNFMNVYTGVLLAFCNDIEIKNNSISSCMEGIFLLSSWSIDISLNRISIITLIGIEIRESRRCNIFGNEITTVLEVDYFWWSEIGIYITNSEFNVVSKNNISDMGMGVILEFSANTLLEGNIIFSCQDTAITLFNSSHSILRKNSIANNHDEGIYIQRSSNCSIKSNVFSSNEGYGIFLGFETQTITVTRNDFVENNPGGDSQACDNGEENIFNENYWNDWTDPDENDDGVVDNPYELDGDANNVDLFPLVSSISTFPRLPMNIVSGIIILFLIIGTLTILLKKHRK